VVRALFKHYGLNLPLSPDFQFHSQRKGEASRGIPDIQVKDDGGKTLAIIESKFDAAFTRHQPNSYLKELGEGGLLLFVVPERHQRVRFEQLMDSCRKHSPEPHSVVTELGGTRASVDGRIFVVTSWQNAISILQQSVQELLSDRKQQGPCSDIEQLRRFCKVEAKETFLPLTADEISDSRIPILIHHLTWITRKLISKCVEENTVQEIEPSNRGSKNEIQAAFDSSLSFGRNLQLCGVSIWMGFWASAWEDSLKSPLWIEIDSKNSPQARRIVTQLREERGKDFAFQHNFGWEGWLIAIPVKPKVPQDEVVEEAFRFVSDLKTSINKAKSSF